ncbi:MAG: Unknown protein [uncultured Sulfurovum sp.]|uniref:O-antigen polymerase n=1 Tax=uncultured Sulfurovum sp. TaxID=269237 RepID=A0A6S6TWH1_9BACT|nr:MAG: Unknown protein [uncultured Sulfurovum sp.]
MFKLSNIVVFFIMLSILSSYFIGVFGSSMGMLDDFAALMIFLLPIPVIIIFKNAIKKLHNQLFVMLWVFYVVSTFLFLYSSLLPHLYELYKLLTFMIFIPLFMVLKRGTIFQIEDKLLKVVALFLMINTLIVILQYTINPYIINLFGIKIGMENIAFAAGRYSGLFSNPNNLGDLALLMFLLNEIVRPEKYKLFRNIFMISVLTSSSKHAIVILLLLFVYQNRDVVKKKFSKFLLGSILVFAATFFTYSLNQKAFDSKIEQYVRLATVEDTSHIYMGTVESRARKMLKGMVYVDENFPLGTGLGTWGDGSSRLNADNPLKNPEPMSDSAFIHLLVEQGIFILMYLFLMSSGYFSVKKMQKKYFISLMIVYVLAIFPTMGMSSGAWPVIFAYLYARLLFSKKLEQGRVL